MTYYSNTPASGKPVATPDLFGYVPSPPTAPLYPPHGAGFKGERGGTSEEAAKAIALSVTGRRREVLEFLRTKAAEPMTADEIAVALQRSILSIRPRVSELYQMGLVEPHSTRGRNESSGLLARKWRPASS